MNLLFENLTVDNMKFVGIHASNYLPVNGTLQKDKARMLETINSVLASRDRSAIRSDEMRGL